jgi:4-hydroxybenzoate polyprenyltransferase
MNIIKIILIAVGIIVAAMLAFSIVGIVYSALWYLFLLGIVAIGGAVGYKLLVKDKETPQLEDKTAVTIAEMKNADRALEEYKRKYLSK